MFGFLSFKRIYNCTKLCKTRYFICMQDRVFLEHPTSFFKILQELTKIVYPIYAYLCGNHETMKKLLVLFISFFYLAMAAGFTKYTHLCKGTETQFFSFSSTVDKKSDKPCPICAAKEKGLEVKKKDCCQQSTQLAKVDEGVKKHFNFDFSVKFWGDAIPNKMLGAVFDYSLPVFETQKTTSFYSNKISPQGNPLYILNCVYRI